MTTAAIAAALAPFLPETSEKITAALRWEGKTLRAKKVDALFPRMKNG